MQEMADKLKNDVIATAKKDENERFLPNFDLTSLTSRELEHLEAIFKAWSK